jgi:hypothetical protein
MSPNLLRIIGTIVAGGLSALGHSGLIQDLPPFALDSLTGLLVGWLHIAKPGQAKKPQAPTYDGTH